MGNRVHSAYNIRPVEPSWLTGGVWPGRWHSVAIGSICAIAQVLRFCVCMFGSSSSSIFAIGHQNLYNVATRWTCTTITYTRRSCGCCFGSKSCGTKRAPMFQIRSKLWCFNLITPSTTCMQSRGFKTIWWHSVGYTVLCL